jgi:hypothetical protein
LKLVPESASCNHTTSQYLTVGRFFVHSRYWPVRQRCRSYRPATCRYCAVTTARTASPLASIAVRNICACLSPQPIALWLFAAQEERSEILARGRGMAPIDAALAVQCNGSTGVRSIAHLTSLIARHSPTRLRLQRMGKRRIVETRARRKQTKERCTPVYTANFGPHGKIPI